MPRILLKIGVALAATVLALLIAELLARAIGHRPEFGLINHLEGYPTRTVDGVVLWDAGDLRYERDDIRRAAEDSGAFTILGLGDSIMHGVQVAKEQTYLEQTRRILERRSPRRVRVLNTAVPGYNTLQENALYKELDGDLAPDLVLLHYWGNDVWQFRVIGGYAVDFGDVAPDGSIRRALPLPQPLSDFLLLHSRMYDLLTHVLVTSTRETHSYDWSRVTTPLGEIQERAQRSDARLLVLASADLTGPIVQPTADLAQLREFTDARGIEVIDLSEWLRDVPASEIALDACHFNVKGHRLIGERLAEYLLAHDLKS